MYIFMITLKVLTLNRLIRIESFVANLVPAYEVLLCVNSVSGDRHQPNCTALSASVFFALFPGQSAAVGNDGGLPRERVM